MTDKTIVQKLIEKYGSVAKASRAMDTSSATLYMWIKGVFKMSETSRKKAEVLLNENRNHGQRQDR